MNKKLCVTSGYLYTDIDVLACVLAYAELKNCIAWLPGEFNTTVPKSIRNWNLNFTKEFPKQAEEFVIADFSNYKLFSPEIPQDKIIKVYDHHAGFENYWGNKGQIEFIGACATMIYELFGDRKPSPTVANLLYTAIFANTLNFKANVTTDRDRAAFKKLEKFISLPKDWIKQYYSEVEKDMLFNPLDAIKNDTQNLANGWAISQLELYDAKALIKGRKFPLVLKAFMQEYKNWLLTIPSISEGKNYLISNSSEIRNFMSKKFNAEWNESVLEFTPPLHFVKFARRV